DQLVTDEGDALNLITHTFVDDEPQGEPLVLLVELELPANLGIEVAERTVIGRELVDISIDLVTIDESLEEHRDWRPGIDLRFEPFAAHEFVPNKFDLPDLLRRAFVDDIHDAMIGRLVAFQDADLNVVKPVAMIQIDQAPAGFLHGIGIDRATNLQVGFLGE